MTDLGRLARRFNPLLLHALRQTLRTFRRLGRTRGEQTRIVGAGLAAYVAALAICLHIMPDRWRNTDAVQIIVEGLLLALLIVTPSLSAGAFAQERQNGTLDLLLTCPLTNVELVRGKLLAALLAPTMATALVLPFLIISSGESAALDIPLVLCLAGPSTLLYAMLGLNASARVASVVRARAWATGLALGIGLLPLILDQATAQLLGRHGGHWSVYLSPVALAYYMPDCVLKGTALLIQPPLMLFLALLLFWRLERDLDRLLRYREPRRAAEPEAALAVPDDPSYPYAQDATAPARRRGLLDNPILRRELRARLRGSRALWLQAAYVVVLSAVVVLIYCYKWQDSEAIADGRLGSLLFEQLLFNQSLLLCLMVPALAAGSVSAEHEQQTMDSLLASAMSTGRIFWGKLVAAAAFPLLLLICGVPFLALVYLMGGIALTDILGAFGLQLAVTLLLSAIGVGCSLHARTTPLAAGAAYLATLVYLYATRLLAGARGPFDFVCPTGLDCSTGTAPSAWLVAIGLTLLAAVAVSDFGICRLRLLRDGMVSVRPRLWWLALMASFAYLAIGEQEIAVYVVLSMIMAMVLVSGDDGVQARRPVGTWEFWRHGPDSAPLFVMLVASVPLVWLLLSPAAEPGNHFPNLGDSWLAVALVVALTRVLHGRTGRVWPARFVAVALALVVCLAYGADGTLEKLLSPWEPTADSPVFAATRHSLYLGALVVTLLVLWLQHSAPSVKRSAANPR